MLLNDGDPANAPIDGLVTLVAESMPAGAHQVLWRGVDERGVAVSSGVYFYRLQTGDYTHMRRMLLLK